MNFYKLNPLQVGSGTIIPEGFIEYTEEPQELLDALAVEKEAQDLQAKVNEAQQYLTSTDHKFFNGYKPKVKLKKILLISKQNVQKQEHLLEKIKINFLIIFFI